MVCTAFAVKMDRTIVRLRPFHSISPFPKAVLVETTSFQRIYHFTVWHLTHLRPLHYWLAQNGRPCIHLLQLFRLFHSASDFAISLSYASSPRYITWRPMLYTTNLRVFSIGTMFPRPDCLNITTLFSLELYLSSTWFWFGSWSVPSHFIFSVATSPWLYLFIPLLHQPTRPLPTYIAKLKSY